MSSECNCVECKICGAWSNSEGTRFHGRGCFSISPEGGGEDEPELCDTCALNKPLMAAAYLEFIENSGEIGVGKCKDLFEDCYSNECETAREAFIYGFKSGQKYPGGIATGISPTNLLDK